MGDKEGRWQAFIDYSNTYNAKFLNEKYLIENGIEEEEIGDIEDEGKAASLSPQQQGSTESLLSKLLLDDESSVSSKNDKDDNKQETKVDRR